MLLRFSPYNLCKKVEGHVSNTGPGGFPFSLLHPFPLFHVSDSRKPIEKPSEPIPRQIPNIILREKNMAETHLCD